METIDSVIQNPSWVKRLQKAMIPERYDHAVRVAKTAYDLARIHGADPIQAATAGYLHDCAKDMSDKKLLKKAKKYEIEMSEAEKDNADLLHAKVGAFVAHDKYDVHDLDVLSAIMYHTTGRPDMSLLEKIMYISDYIEPGRKPRGRIEAIREMAQTNIDHAVLWILEDTLEYLSHKSKTKDPMTQKAYDFYNNLRKETL